MSVSNSISDGEVIVSSAVEVLDDLLAPLGNFSINFGNETSTRGAVVRVPLIDSADSARDYIAPGTTGAGYEANAGSDAKTIDLTLAEVIKPFNLSDNELYKSPVNLSNYIGANANAFGAFILGKVKTAIENTTGGASPTASATKSATALDLTTIKTLVKKLDSSGVPVSDRHLVVSSTGHHSLLPSTQDTYGTNAQVMQSGRVGQLYGLNVHPTSVLEQANTAGKCVAFATGKNGLAIANRLPETQGKEALVAYEPFTIPGLGLQCIYRSHYNTATGQLFGCFSTLFACKVADQNSIAWVKGA